MPRTWSAVLARTGVPTGDGRTLVEGAGSSRTLPRPLMYQRETSDGHGGAIVVGRIESVRMEHGMVTATGSLLDSAPHEVIESLEAEVIGPSVDLDDIEYVADEEGNSIITKWRIAGATLVAVPAFADVSLTLDPLPVGINYTDDVEVAAYQAELATFATATQEAMAKADVLPPVEWFARPEVAGLTPLTVTEDGRVFGHIAGWGECHVGLPGCITAPASMTNYAHFMVGEQRVQGGGTVPVGTLVTGPRHADPHVAYAAAQAHYDDLDAAVARVVAGEDQYGIWVAGWMIPSAAPSRVEQFLASPVSGDWRRIGGSLEMIAVCSVNAPGFPVPRARVAFSNGAQRSLIGSFGVRAQRGELPVAAAPEPITDSLTAVRAAWALMEWK